MKQPTPLCSFGPIGVLVREHAIKRENDFSAQSEIPTFNNRHVPFNSVEGNVTGVCCLHPLSEIPTLPVRDPNLVLLTPPSKHSRPVFTRRQGPPLEQVEF